MPTVYSSAERASNSLELRETFPGCCPIIIWMGWEEGAHHDSPPVMCGISSTPTLSPYRSLFFLLCEPGPSTVTQTLLAPSPQTALG